MWKVNPEKESNEFWLELISNTDIDGSDYYWYAAQIKQDGCIHFYQANNVPYCQQFGTPDSPRDEGACDEYIHICDLDDHIKRLISLRDAAKKHFGDKWNKE